MLVTKNQHFEEDLNETEDDFVKQIMNIYYNQPDKIAPNLNVSPSVGHEISNQICDLFNNEYVSKWGCNIADHDFQMIINLKHDTLISFRPRRLSFWEKLS